MKSTPQDHAKFSASGAHRWIRCPGSIHMEEGVPDRSSSYAEEGTVAHEVAAQSMQQSVCPSDFVYKTAAVKDGKFIEFDPAVVIDGTALYEVTPDMVEHVETYIEHVKDFAAVPGAILLVEQRVYFSHYVGVKDQYGTSDAVVVTPDEITVIDLKYGMGVQVDADENEQLMLYALGAYDKFHFYYPDIKRMRMVVVQPRLNHVSEWSCDLEELFMFAQRAKRAVQASRRAADNPEAALNPGEKQCRFCKAKGTCPALANYVTSNITDDFVDLDNTDQAETKMQNAIDNLKAAELKKLSTMMKLTDLAEIWIKGVREAVYVHLMRGEEVPDFKIVRGREGARKWEDYDAAENTLVKTVSEEAYVKKLISPTEAEKKLKKVAPGVWEILQGNVTRTPGKLSVAPASDKRPAEAVDGVSAFEDLGDEE